MKILILAAGMGNRLGDMTNECPKALIDVGGEALIDRMLGFATHPAVSRIGVVGGFFSKMLKEHLGGRDIDYYTNPHFKDGNIFTLQAATDFLDDSFLMMNVDHIYPKELLDHIVKNSSGITAMCDKDRKLVHDDMKVKLTDDGKLMKISKTLSEYDAGYIGMTYCASETLSQYKQAIEETINIYGRESCVEWILGHLAANDTEINICDTSGYRWSEVDTPDDLQQAEKTLLKG